jgi:proline iminopeptidase
MTFAMAIRQGEPHVIYSARAGVLRVPRCGLNRSDRPLTSPEATARFRINLYRRMLYDVANWPLLTGGRGMYRAHVGPLTEKTYPTSGWDYFAEFKRRTYPVAIIVGDHDFIDFGNGIIRKWTQDNPRIALTVIEKAGHLLWIDQPGVLAQALSRHLHAPATAAR